MRLNKTLKDQITNNAVKDVFKKRDEALMREGSLLVQKVHKDRAAGNQEAAARQNALLRDTVRRANEAAGGQVFRLGSERCTFTSLGLYGGHWQHEDSIHNYLNKEGKFTPDENGNPGTVGVELYTTYGSGIWIEQASDAHKTLIDKFLKKRSRLREDKQKLTSKIRSCLNSVTTLQKLVNTYPDLEKYVPESAGNTGLVLTVPPADLMAEMQKLRDEPKDKRSK